MFGGYDENGNVETIRSYNIQKDKWSLKELEGD